MPAVPDRAARGRALLAERARRVRRVRARIVAVVVAAFALLWGLIATTGSMAGTGDAQPEGAHRDAGASGRAGSDVLTTRQS
jgi:hypothetical protein